MSQIDTVSLNVVVLGGGDPSDAFAAAHGVSVKPLIPVGTHRMAWYVLKALRDSGRVQTIAYVGPTTPELDELIDLRVTDRGSLIANLEGGLYALSQAGQTGQTVPSQRVLIATADIPMLSAEEVRDVVDKADPNAALVYPVVRREVCEAAYPQVKRTYAKLKDGTFTGGNLFILDPKLVGQFLPRLREVLAARKNPFKLAGMIGPSVLLKLLSGRLTVPDLEASISKILGVKAKALITPHAAVGTDVDKDADLVLALSQLKILAE